MRGVAADRRDGTGPQARVPPQSVLGTVFDSVPSEARYAEAAVRVRNFALVWSYDALSSGRTDMPTAASVIDSSPFPLDHEEPARPARGGALPRA